MLCPSLMKVQRERVIVPFLQGINLNNQNNCWAAIYIKYINIYIYTLYIHTCINTHTYIYMYVCMHCNIVGVW